MAFLVRRKGFEPLTFWFVAKHSIRLSYRRTFRTATKSLRHLTSITDRRKKGKQNFQIFSSSLCRTPKKRNFPHLALEKNRKKDYNSKGGALLKRPNLLKRGPL